MSMYAEFRLVPVDQLEGLLEASGGTYDEYRAYLDENAGAPVDFPLAGGVLSVALTYLEDEFGLPLTKSEHERIATWLAEGHGLGHVIFTKAQRDEYRARLDMDAFDEGELRDYFNREGKCDEAEAGAWMRTGIQAIRDVLGQVDEDNVVLLSFF